MRKMILALALSATALVASPAMATDTVTYNSAPTDSFIYGSGNDYVPANSAVLTSEFTELALRFHQTFVAAPASDGSGVYSFALGTDPMSFDWGIDGFSDGALITLVNLATNAKFSYNPFFDGNDNTGSATDGDLAQNSFRLNWAGIGFDPAVNDTYSATLTAGGHSLTAYAKLGTGAPVPGVPEPATWAMMLLGFGAVGFAMRRKSSAGMLQAA
jgi:PEP-CTERM motif-containing protein